MMTVSGEAVSEEKVGLWEDFVDIFYAPSEVFARRRAAGFWMPLLVVAVVATILSFGTSRILEAPADADAQRQTREMVRENPELDVSGARTMTETIGEVLVWFTGFFVASAVDLFAIWWLVVLAIGLAVIGNMPRARAAAVVAGIWVVLSLPAFIGAVTG